jgi:hypothetical protein
MDLESEYDPDTDIVIAKFVITVRQTAVRGRHKDLLCSQRAARTTSCGGLLGSLGVRCSKSPSLRIESGGTLRAAYTRFVPFRRSFVS